MVNDLGKLEIYFKYGVKNLKNLQTIFKMIVKASKVSIKNMNKSLNSMKKVGKRFKIVCFKILTD